MCVFSKPKASETQAVTQAVPNPEATAEPTQIGNARKKEDDELFGGVPDLRVDRSTPTSVASSGAGLNLM